MTASAVWTLWTDGACRGNPGPSATGWVLRAPDGTTHRGGTFLGRKTNNEAEYEALIEGLQRAISRGASDLLVQSDSELLVKQINGQYRVKNERIRPLFARASKLLGELESTQVKHVYREHNREADAEANSVLDASLRH